MATTNIVIAFLGTATAILVPPLAIRFLIWRKPINTGWIRLIISLVFYIPNLVVVSHLGRNGALDIFILIGIWVCYDILKYKNKDQQKGAIEAVRKKLGYD